MKSPIYLVDGSGYIFRAFYAVSPLTTKDGFPTNALFGFTKMFIKLLSSMESSHIAVVFDAGRETFRNELYPLYKANRKEPPEELIPQFPLFREISKSLGLLTVEQSGYEADDIIGTLARKLSSYGHEIIIVSGDKDLMQLVTDSVTIYDPMKDKNIGREEVVEKFGVPPEKVVDALAILGDSSDNIPGLKGVGPKGAVQLLAHFNSAEDLIERKEEILNISSLRGRSSIYETLQSSCEQLLLSKKLVEIKCDVPLLLTNGKDCSNCNEEELLSLLTRSAPTEEFTNLMNRLEFGSLLEQVPGVQRIEVAENKNYQAVLDDGFSSFLDEAGKWKQFAFDLETTSFDPFSSEIVGVSFCGDGDRAYYIPLAHQGVSGQVSFEKFKEKFSPIFLNREVKKCAQNGKFDLKMLSTKGIEVEGLTFDPMIAAYLLHSDWSSYNLTVLSEQYLSRPLTEFTDLVAKGDTFASVPLDKATQYGCQDSHVAFTLWNQLEEDMKKEGLIQVFTEVEMPLVKILAGMELKGIKLDTELFSRMSDEFSKKLAIIEGEIYQIAGEKFNINSPKQLSEILFNRLQIPTKGLKKTKTGVSTDSSVLEKLSVIHPLPHKILEYRGVFKLKSTYVDTLPKQINPVTGRLHTTFNQTGTSTGRLSSSDPNLQNIPIQGEDGQRIREGFISREGHSLLSADYSQIELRVLAHMAGDREMSEAFRDDVDIHAQTAREIFGLPAGAPPTSDQRRYGKTINFGIVYGMGAFRLARELNISVSQATDYIDRYFKTFSGVKQFFTDLEEKVLKDGYVTTITGRKRVLSDMDLSGRDKGFMLRAALNAPIQGSAADIIKIAMVKLSQEKELSDGLLLQIHDELLFELPESEILNRKKVIEEKMENALQLSVPLKVSSAIGKNWREAHG